MREIPVSLITETVKKLFINANTCLPIAVENCLNNSFLQEQTEIGEYVFSMISQNIEIAKAEDIPLCQDTGIANVFVEVGQDVRIVGGLISDAITTGVKQAYLDGYLRKSLCNPFTRENTTDNTPAFIHYDIVAGNQIKIIAMPKGGGSENVSVLAMLTPAAGMVGVKKFVLEHVKKAGANPCPPIIVGVGIGASFDTVAGLAKKALLRPLGSHNEEKKLAVAEAELLVKINKLGIGPAGLGGTVSALAVHIESRPCHIASMPVAVNIQCHVARHAEAIL